MAHGLTGLDHVLVAVDDLEAARAGWTRLGFTPTPRGRHRARRTGNYCIMFADDYVELIGLVEGDAPPSRLESLLAERGEGLIGAALGTRGTALTHARMAAAGLEPLPPAELTRLLELPEGPVEPRFQLVELPPERTPEFRLFVCDHLTPELLRRPRWLDHPNGALGLRSLAVVVAEPERLAPAYEALFGPGSTATTDDTLTVFFNNYRLLFVTEGDLAFMFPDVDLPERAAVPRGAALGIAVADIEATAGYLAGAGVPHARAADGALHVAPAEANGVLLEFVAG